jgi:hypothetical protein
MIAMPFYYDHDEAETLHAKHGMIASCFALYFEEMILLVP